VSARGFADVRALAREKGIPLALHVELTYRCNARCVHCFQERSAAPRELGAAAWRGVLDDARRLGVLFLTVSGGEALLSPHFWEVAEHARAAGFAVTLLTNGILLDRARVRRLAALSPAAVEISIFSTRAAHHDAVTGVPGSLSAAIRGALRLRKAGIAVALKCPLVGDAAADHAAVAAFAARIGATFQLDAHLFASTAGGTGPTRCRGDDAAIQAALAASGPPPDGGPPPGAPPERAPCGMARTFVVVSPAGDVLPCAAMPLSAGNVRDRSLDAIWRESPLLGSLRARRWGDLPECAACPRRGYCGRCSALALLEDGDLDGPSSRACRIAELREGAWGLPPPAGAPEPRPPRGLRVLNGG
jgi:AdoMet-dependent heme synthase